MSLYFFLSLSIPLTWLALVFVVVKTSHFLLVYISSTSSHSCCNNNFSSCILGFLFLSFVLFLFLFLFSFFFFLLYSWQLLFSQFCFNRFCCILQFSSGTFTLLLLLFCFCYCCCCLLYFICIFLLFLMTFFPLTRSPSSFLVLLSIALLIIFSTLFFALFYALKIFPFFHCSSFHGYTQLKFCRHIILVSP